MSLLVDEREINCVQCKRYLGCVRDDCQYFQIGNIQIYMPVRILCKNCGRPYRFRPIIPPDPLSEEQSAERNHVRNNLGKKVRQVSKTED